MLARTACCAVLTDLEKGFRGRLGREEYLLCHAPCPQRLRDEVESLVLRLASAP